MDKKNTKYTEFKGLYKKSDALYVVLWLLARFRQNLVFFKIMDKWILPYTQERPRRNCYKVYIYRLGHNE